MFSTHFNIPKTYITFSSIAAYQYRILSLIKELKNVQRQPTCYDLFNLDKSHSRQLSEKIDFQLHIQYASRNLSL